MEGRGGVGWGRGVLGLLKPLVLSPQPWGGQAGRAWHPSRHPSSRRPSWHPSCSCVLPCVYGLAQVSMNEMMELAMAFGGTQKPIKHIPGPEGVRGRNRCVPGWRLAGSRPAVLPPGGTRQGGAGPRRAAHASCLSSSSWLCTISPPCLLLSPRPKGWPVCTLGASLRAIPLSGPRSHLTPTPPSPSFDSCSDNKLILEKLGWEPSVKLADGLRVRAGQGRAGQGRALAIYSVYQSLS